MTVLYIVAQFPSYSETFIVDEIRSHLESGTEIAIAVLGNTQSADFPIERYGDQIASRTIYLGIEPSTAIRRRLRLLSAGLASVSLQQPVEAWRLWRSERLSAREVLAGSIIASKVRDVEIIHCHFGHIGRLGLAVKRLLPSDPGLVVTFHAFEMVKPWSQPLAVYYRPLFRSDALLLPISEHWRSELLAAGASEKRTLVHHMGVEVPGGNAVQKGVVGRTASLIVVGRMVEKKGHRTAIAALRQLRERRPDIDFRCDVIGNGPLREAIGALVEEQGLSGIVRFLGSKPHAETLQAIGAADALLLPSVTAADGDMEGVPVVLMEAMARGVPVVSTRHSGIPELIDDGVSGLLAAEGDSAGLAEAIIRILSDMDLRRQLSAGARAKVLREFNRATQFDKLLNHYRSLRRECAG